MMGNLAVIDLCGISVHAWEPVFGGDSAIQRVMGWAREVPEYSGTVFLAFEGDRLPDGVEVATESDVTLGDGASVAIILKESQEDVLVGALGIAAGIRILKENNEGVPCGALFLARGDWPLIDGEVTRTLWDIHVQYYAQYTFADGYPAGLTPQILSADFPEKVRSLAEDKKTELQDQTLFDILCRDINAFDVETHLSPVDLRMQRVSISCDTPRNIRIAEELYRKGGVDAASLCTVIPQNMQALRSLPSFFPIQITNHCPQSCSYCPFPQMSGDPRKGKDFMDKDMFAQLCRRIADFSEDAVIGLSLWGEPSSHPDIETLIIAALEQSGRQHGGHGVRVLVETSCIGWDPEVPERLARQFHGGQLLWILSLDASDRELYTTLRGDGFEEAERTAELLVRLFGSYCWVQAVRMNENDEHLEDFYRHWTGKGAQVIFQKYNSFAEKLPLREPSDLSPISRFPCWHIKRDMPVYLDGTVPHCKEDLGRRKALGNVFVDDLETIWKAGEQLHSLHAQGTFPDHCARCNEYYTFNF